MLDQDGEHPLHGAEDGTVNDDGVLMLVLTANKEEVETGLPALVSKR